LTPERSINMTDDSNSALFEALEKLFHEPNRLSIMSAVCAAESPLPFIELKETCGLTDGNLNRHLKVLEEAGAVRIKKAFVDGKPRTTVVITRRGLDRFNVYLEALGRVLRKAKRSLPREKGRVDLPLGGLAEAR